MILSECHIYKYHLPLKESLQIGNATVNSREGILIELRTDSDAYGFGEAAPLPGLHQENLTDTINQLTALKPVLLGISLQNVYKLIDTYFQENSGYPSVHFAVESAIENLYIADKHYNKSNVLAESVNDQIFVNTLVTGNYNSVMRRVEQSRKDSYRAIKVKIGRKSLEEEIRLIDAIQKNIGKSVSLRLDANRSWSLEEASIFAQNIDCSLIEYIEEPLKNYKLLKDLYQKTGLPIAVDESLTEMSPILLQQENWIDTIILKPAVLGSLKNTCHYISLGKKLGIKTVISDTFHSGVGLSFLIRLASTISDEIPMGFDTYNWLADDILLERLTVNHGCFDLKSVMDLCTKVDYSKLERVG
jgi:O-succinylbenzoate synthase